MLFRSAFNIKYGDSQFMNYDKLCKDVLELEPQIRFAGIYTDSGDIKGVGLRENVKSLLNPEESKMSLYYSSHRWKTGKTLSYRMGKEKYSITEFEKVKLISIPIADKHLLLLSTEPTVDHDSIIKGIFKLIETHSKES